MAKGRMRRCSASLIAGETQNHSETAPRAWEHGFRHTSRDDKPGGGTRSPHPLLLGPEQGTAAADDATEAPPRVKHAAAAWPGNPVSGYSPGEEESAYPKRCLRSHVHRGLVSSRGDVEADNRQTVCDARTEISRL